MPKKKIDDAPETVILVRAVMLEDVEVGEGDAAVTLHANELLAMPEDQFAEMQAENLCEDAVSVRFLESVPGVKGDVFAVGDVAYIRRSNFVAWARAGIVEAAPDGEEFKAEMRALTDAHMALKETHADTCSQLHETSLELAVLRETCGQVVAVFGEFLGGSDGPEKELLAKLTDLLPVVEVASEQSADDAGKGEA